MCYVLLWFCCASGEVNSSLLYHQYFGHLCRDHGCQITKTKTVVEGYVEGRQRRGRPRKQYTVKIKKWPQLTTSQCVRAAERPQPLQSSDGGQRSHMICLKEEGGGQTKIC